MVPDSWALGLLIAWRILDVLGVDANGLFAANGYLQYIGIICSQYFFTVLIVIQWTTDSHHSEICYNSQVVLGQETIAIFLIFWEKN